MRNFIFVYPAVLEELSEGGYLVRFPDFPEAITQGDTEEAAIQAAVDCLEETIANRIVMKLDIPPCSPATPQMFHIPLNISLAAKCALYLAMKNSGYKNVTLARELQCDEKEIRRLLDPRYKSKIYKIQQVLNFLGEKLTLSVSNHMHDNIVPPLKPFTSSHSTATR